MPISEGRYVGTAISSFSFFSVPSIESVVMARQFRAPYGNGVRNPNRNEDVWGGRATRKMQKTKKHITEEVDRAKDMMITTQWRNRAPLDTVDNYYESEDWMVGNTGALRCGAVRCVAVRWVWARCGECGRGGVSVPIGTAPHRAIHVHADKARLRCYLYAKGAYVIEEDVHITTTVDLPTNKYFSLLPI